MNCQKYRREIEEAGPGARASDGATAHAASCDACRQFAQERARLRALVAGLQTVAAPDDFEFRLRARLASRKGGGGGALSWWPRYAPGAALAAFAACCLLAVGVALRAVPWDAPTNGVEVSKAAHVSTTEASKGEAKNSDVMRPEDVASKTSEGEQGASAKVDERSFVRTPRGGLSSAPFVRVARREGKSSLSGTAVAVRKRSARPPRAGVELTDDAVLETRDSAFAAAQNFTVGEPIPLPVNPSAQPLRVVLRDEQGASRVVAINPVSFGAQEFVGQGGGTVRAKQPPREGVW